MSKQIDIKDKLTMRGIFLIYNRQVIKESFPFKLSLTISLLYALLSFLLSSDQLDFAKFLIDKIDTLFPNLIGFSLGGYAIIVAFGNTDFLKRIAKSGKNYYELLNAVFAFSILVQVLVLFIALVSEVFVKATKEMEFPHDYKFYQWVNLCFNTVTLFFVAWALSLIPYVVSNIFIFGETHHELLRNEPDEKPNDNSSSKPK